MKTMKCKECGKKYKKWNAWLDKHIAKTGHVKFEKRTGGQAWEK